MEIQSPGHAVNTPLVDSGVVVKLPTAISSRSLYIPQIFIEVASYI